MSMERDSLADALRTAYEVIMVLCGELGEMEAGYCRDRCPLRDGDECKACEIVDAMHENGIEAE